jgi:hypothetical protein
MRFICLANSNKHGGRCIAGVDEAGNWIRPVSSSPKRAVNKDMRTIDGDEPQIMDILEVPLYTHGPAEGCQRENKLLKEGPWKKVDRIKTDELLKYCEDDSVILHNHLDHVRAVCFGIIPRHKWKSLQLVRNRSVNFERDSNDKNKWRASFADGKNNHLNLVVTDPVICDKLERGEKISNDCLLTVSLGPAWSPNKNTAKRCYKFVAGVIEL